MSKIAIIYYSNTGNTEAMAEAVFSGAEYLGADVELFEVQDFLLEAVDDYDAFAFGCPASGDEELEEFEFEPVFSFIIENIEDIPIAIFGSYSYGDGEWMNKWEELCDDMGLNLIASGVIANESPSAEELAECQDLGERLAEYVED